MPLYNTTIIQALPRLTWRGLYAPYEDVSADFGHRQPAREMYGVDGEGHHHTGRRAHHCRGRLFFINGVEGYDDAFPTNWRRWRAALFDGSAGDLEHPVLGTFKARVLDGSLEIVSKMTAGIVVVASWTETVIIDRPNQAVDPEPDAYTVAKAAQAAADSVGVSWPQTGLSTSLVDAVGVVLSSVFEAQVTFAGLANQVKGGIEDMIGRVELIADPSASPAYDNLVRLWDVVDQLGKKAERELGRSTAVRVTQHDTTLDLFASEVKNEVADLMALNPALLRSPLVPKGSPVTFYSGK